MVLFWLVEVLVVVLFIRYDLILYLFVCLIVFILYYIILYLFVCLCVCVFVYLCVCVCVFVFVFVFVRFSQPTCSAFFLLFRISETRILRFSRTWVSTRKKQIQ